MEKEQYNNLLHRINKSNQKFKLTGTDKKKENKTLEYLDKNKKKIIGWSHRNKDNLIFGFVRDDVLSEVGEVNFRNLKEIFKKSKN